MSDLIKKLVALTYLELEKLNNKIEELDSQNYEYSLNISKLLFEIKTKESKKNILIITNELLKNEHDNFIKKINDYEIKFKDLVYNIETKKKISYELEKEYIEKEQKLNNKELELKL